jgi:predicted DNA binding CopG/RHH family protein
MPKMKKPESEPQTQVITIRLLKGDIDRARELAKPKGIGYQTYLRLLLHDALETAR